MLFGCELDGLRCIWVGHRWWWLQLVGFGLFGGGLFWGVWVVLGCLGPLGRLGCSGMSGPVWVIGPISIWVVRDVWDVLFVAGFMSLLPLSPLLVATTGRFSWLAVSASSKFGFPCQVQVQAQVEVQNGHARLLPARQVRWVGGMWDAGGRRNLQDSSTRNTAPASNNKDIGQNRSPGFDYLSRCAAPQEGGSVNLHPFSIQHPASSITQNKNEGRWLQNGRCRIRKASGSSPAPATPLQGRKKGGPSGDIQSVRPINSHAVQ